MICPREFTSAFISLVRIKAIRCCREVQKKLFYIVYVSEGEVQFLILQ